MWNNIPKEEQETIINIDYYTKTVTLFTNRKSIYRRLVIKFGKPTKINYINGNINSVEYTYPLDTDQDIKKLFSTTTLIGGYRNKYNKGE